VIDLVVVREAYDRKQIAQLAFLRTNWNSADALTTVSRNTYLETILMTETIDYPVAQWVVRRRVLAQKKDCECRNTPLLTGVTNTTDESTLFV
jgi:glycogen synthase